MFDSEDNLFLLAGPVKMHPRVLRAMDVAAVAHRGPEFSATNKEIFELLRFVYQTEDPVVCLTGSGTAAMDAALGCLLSKADTVVALDNGKFGNRMAKLAARYAGKVTTVEAPWGQPVDRGVVDQKLRLGAKALVFTHNETSTGFVHPMDKLVRLAHDHGALVIADCITSLGGVDLPVGRLGIDACISGSQKCLGAPSGLSFVSLSAQARAGLHEHASLYLDLPRYLGKLEEGQTPFTPATHLHFALLEALRIIKDEGLATRFARVARTARASRAAASALGLQLFPHADYASDTVTAMRVPDGVKDAELRGALKEMGIVAAGAQDAIKGKVFRIGHMGTVDVRDVVAFFANLEIVLARLGRKVEFGASASAISDALAR